MKIVWLGVLATVSCRGDAPKQSAATGGSGPVQQPIVQGSGSGGSASDTACVDAITAALAKVPAAQWSSTDNIAPTDPAALAVAEAVGFDPPRPGRGSEGAKGGVRLKTLRGWLVKRAVAVANACTVPSSVPAIVAVESSACVDDAKPQPQCSGAIVWVRITDGSVLARAAASGSGATPADAQRAFHAALDAIVTPWTANIVPK